MTDAKPSRLNARVSQEVARKVAYLERRTRMSTTEVVRESIERYYAAVSQEDDAPGAVLERAGFVACADGPEDLSTSYKAELSHSLEKKG